MPGLKAGQIHIRAAACLRTGLGDTRARTRTGASIVATSDEDKVGSSIARLMCCEPEMSPS